MSAELHIPGSRASTSVQLARCTQQLREALRRRRAPAALRLYQAVYGAGLNPRRTLAAATAAELPVHRAWYEAWDDIVHDWWLAPRGKSLWRKVLSPGAQGFSLPLLNMNAWWLRLSGSSRAGAPEPLPSPTDLADASPSDQARALGRFLARCDSLLPLEYDTIARALRPGLLPAFANWFLSTYLMSPLTNLSAAAQRNREEAAARFATFHSQAEVHLPFVPLLGNTLYRSVYFTGDVRPFAEATVEGILAPSFRRQLQDAPDATPTRGVGVMLSCWTKDHPVRRCNEPMLGTMLHRGVCGVLCDAHASAAQAELGEQWKDAPNSVVSMGSVATPAELIAAAHKVRKKGLELLYYPEVGLSLASRWLSTQRLARVQAAGYGHPATTGAHAIDYFVGGSAVERDADCYTERLVLLPGLGVASTRPPLPSGARARPLDDDEVRIISFASFDKLNPGLLRAWDGVLADTRAELHLYPGLQADQLESFWKGARPHLTSKRLEVWPAVPRQACTDALHEADLYLDSFPYSGYNTLVEAFASGCPVVTLERKHAYGRFGAAMVRMLGLPDFLVARDAKQYVAAARRLVEDASLRREIRALLSRERVLDLLCSTDMAPHFEAAVEWMRKEGPGSKGPPVLIRAGEPPRLLTQGLR